MNYSWEWVTSKGSILFAIDSLSVPIQVLQANKVVIDRLARKKRLLVKNMRHDN